MTVTLDRLVGLIPTQVIGTIGDETFKITFSNGAQVTFYHEQDCCESVDIDDIVGDVTKLIGNPLTKACLKISDEDTPPTRDDSYPDDSTTWTFITLATVKGYVDIKFFGTSNGYYSETVDVKLVTPEVTYKYESYNDHKEQI